MIDSITIENFKAISGPTEIPLRPITLIFGANSSGKSSILQSLLLLKQSLRSRKKLMLTTKGEYVDLGRYEDFISGQDLKNDFSLKFTMDNDHFAFYPETTSRSENEKTLMDCLVSALGDQTVSAKLTYEFEKTGHNAVLAKVDLFVGEEPQALICYEAAKGCLAEIPPDEQTIIGYSATANPHHLFWESYARECKDHLLGSYETSGLNLTKEAIESIKKAFEDGQNDTKKESPIESIFKKFKGDTLSDEDAEEIKQLYLETTFPAEKRLSQALLKDSFDPADLENVVEMIAIADVDVNNKHLPDSLSIPFYSERTGMESSYLREFDKITGDSGEEDPDDADPGMFLLNASWRIENFLSNVRYIEPLRKTPKRYYSTTDDDDLNNAFGEVDFADVFKSELDANLINKALNNLGLPYKIEIVRFQDNKSTLDDLFSINVVNTKTGVTSSIKDVGFGISQVLPIVFSSVMCAQKTILIEQPELHLHPAMQAELGDLFLDSALSLGDSYNNNFLIETHSEHLILRLLRRIRETTEGTLLEGLPAVVPEDVAILYVKQGEHGAEVTHIPITEDGDFACPWPEGFFAERARELM